MPGIKGVLWMKCSGWFWICKSVRIGKHITSSSEIKSRHFPNVCWLRSFGQLFVCSKMYVQGISLGLTAGVSDNLLPAPNASQPIGFKTPIERSKPSLMTSMMF